MARGAALVCVHICFGNAPSPSEVAQGDAGPESGGRNGCGRQKFSFIRQKSLSPATVFPTSRNRFFVSPCLNAPTRDASPLVVAFLLAPNAITKRYHQTLTLMGATRLASGKKAINKGSQTALITCLSVSLCLNVPTRDASPPLEVAFGAWVRSRIHVLPDYNIKSISYRTTVVHQRASVMITVTSRAPWAPNTRACSMSAVLEGPEMKQPKGAAVGSGNWW